MRKTLALAFSLTLVSGWALAEDSSDLPAERICGSDGHAVVATDRQTNSRIQVPEGYYVAYVASPDAEKWQVEIPDKGKSARFVFVFANRAAAKDRPPVMQILARSIRDSGVAVFYQVTLVALDENDSRERTSLVQLSVPEGCKE